MDPVVTALIVACTSLAGNLALLAKVITDKVKLTNERTETKSVRDKDSQELHDKVLKLEFGSAQAKDNIALLFTKMEDSNKQAALLNTQLAQVITKMDSVIETLANIILFIYFAKVVLTKNLSQFLCNIIFCNLTLCDKNHSSLIK